MKIAVACGGTGGHIFPGLATACELQRRGHEVTLWLTGRDTEKAALKEWDGPQIQVPARGFPSGFSFRTVQTAWRLMQAVGICRREMRKQQPAVLLAMGSYASAGPCGAARLLGIPYVLHEANVIPGRVVRLFAGGAASVAAGFEETRYHLRNAPLQVVGIPLRAELLEAARDLPERDKPVHDPLRLLVAGGSLGAHRLNEVIPSVLSRLQKNGLSVSVTHLTGPADEDEVRRIYADGGVDACVIGFTGQMAAHYHQADLAICRAGAATCAELAFFGVPALFVPYPNAAMDHQRANARALEKRGIADVIDEAALTPQWLEAYLTETIRHSGRLARLREAAFRRGVPDGTAALASLVEAAAGSR